MTPEIASLRSRTPVTEAFVRSRLAGQPGLGFEDNMRAYNLRMIEDKHPIFARLVALLWFGPRIAFSRRKTLSAGKDNG